MKYLYSSLLLHIFTISWNPFSTFFGTHTAKAYDRAAIKEGRPKYNLNFIPQEYIDGMKKFSHIKYKGVNKSGKRFGARYTYRLIGI